MTVLSRRSRGAVGNNLSFLDVISAGFGAIVLLLVITKNAAPGLIEGLGLDLEARRDALREALPAVDARIDRLQARLGDRDTELAAAERRIRELERRLDSSRAEQVDRQVAETIADRLQSARQSLTEEMRRLRDAEALIPDARVAGIPVDSEYVIFIIDTSGSMLRQWGNVVRKVEEVLDLYPNVRGIQVMNDMGQLMFDQYSGGQWMPDTPSRRRLIIARLLRWKPFSNSSPIEGITRAIRDFHDPDKIISLYVFGDEFTGISVQQVLDAVDHLNPRGPDGRRRVRIHAVGFPTQFAASMGFSESGMRFALLMRLLTQAHDGTFVGLKP